MRLDIRTKIGNLYAILGFVCALTLVGTVGAVSMAAQSAPNSPSITVNVSADGQSLQYISDRTTVGAVLSQAGVHLDPKDYTVPGLNAKTTHGMTIQVVRVREETVIEKQTLKYKTVTRFSSSPSGETVARKGETGEAQVTWLVTYKDGKPTDKKVLDWHVTKDPKSEIVTISAAQLLSRSGQYLRSIKMVATGYAAGHCGGSASGHAALGMHAGKGIVAVDPRLIPLGTHLYVVGYGYCLAADTGGAIKGNRIDLCFDSYNEAKHAGRHLVTVFILD